MKNLKDLTRMPAKSFWDMAKERQGAAQIKEYAKYAKERDEAFTEYRAVFKKALTEILKAADVAKKLSREKPVCIIRFSEQFEEDLKAFVGEFEELGYVVKQTRITEPAWYDTHRLEIFFPPEDQD